jgi:hypothetical protein
MSTLPSDRFDTMPSPGRVRGEVFRKLAAAKLSIRETTCHLAGWTRSKASSPVSPRFCSSSLSARASSRLSSLLSARRLVVAGHADLLHVIAPSTEAQAGGNTILRVAGCRHRSGQDRGLSSQLLTPDRYDLEVSRPTQRRRRLQALVLAAVAIGLVIVEPFPKGALLVSLTPTHGADVGDLPALALLLVAACLAI